MIVPDESKGRRQIAGGRKERSLTSEILGRISELFKRENKVGILFYRAQGSIF
jgi:hypothetical protein